MSRPDTGGTAPPPPTETPRYCPRCGARPSPLTPRGDPGYCPRCGARLSDAEGVHE